MKDKAMRAIRNLTLVLIVLSLSNCEVVFNIDLYSHASASPNGGVGSAPSSSPAPSVSPTPTPTPTPPATVDVTVTISDPATLTVGFSSSPSTLSASGQIVVSASGVSGATDYLWQLDPAFGTPSSPVDGTTGSSVTVKGSDLIVGTQYTLTLFVMVGGNLYSGYFIFTVTS